LAGGESAFEQDGVAVLPNDHPSPLAAESTSPELLPIAERGSARAFGLMNLALRRHGQLAIFPVFCGMSGSIADLLGSPLFNS
jgi:hypothetical protein